MNYQISDCSSYTASMPAMYDFSVMSKIYNLYETIYEAFATIFAFSNQFKQIGDN